jgi:hypothetical protein
VFFSWNKAAHIIVFLLYRQKLFFPIFQIEIFKLRTNINNGDGEKIIFIKLLYTHSPEIGNSHRLSNIRTGAIVQVYIQMFECTGVWVRPRPLGDRELHPRVK